MKNQKVLKREMKNLDELNGLIGVYEELAASKMQKIREGILSCREFFESLNILSDEVGSDLQYQKEQVAAAVFISANNGLFGDIIDKTFGVFLDYLQKNKADCFIVGLIGKQLMDKFSPKTSYQLLNLPFFDENLEIQSFADLIQKILPYQKIAVFYSKFQNIAVQTPLMSQISGELLTRKTDLSELKKRRLKYLYEPSVEAISRHFTDEILTSVIEQMFRETLLAKQGSRLMHLDQATENINQRLKILVLEKSKAHKNMINKKQNSMTAGLMIRGFK